MDNLATGQETAPEPQLAASGAGSPGAGRVSPPRASRVPGQGSGDAPLAGIPPVVDDYAVGYQRPPRTGDFQKGQSGNPNGRPKGSKNTKAIIEEVLDRDTCIPGLVDPETGGPVSKHVAMIVAQARKAETGDTGAFNAVLDRLDGKATQAVEVGNIGARAEFEAKLAAGLTPQQIAAGQDTAGAEEEPE